MWSFVCRYLVFFISSAFLIQSSAWGHGHGSRHSHGTDHHNHHVHHHEDEADCDHEHDHEHNREGHNHHTTEASRWQMEGRAGLTSNFLDEGHTMTNDNPSLSVGIEAVYQDWLLLGFSMDTLQSPFSKRFQVRWIPMIGIIHHFDNGITGILSYRLYRFTGGNIAHQVGHAHAHHDHNHEHSH